MIDPSNITKYNQTQEELEEMILFWVCAAGKNAQTAARGLDKFLENIWMYPEPTPFGVIRHKNEYRFDVSKELKRCGIGCYNAKSNTFTSLAYSGLDLQNCSVEELEEIPGIGPKTARCFLIHSRKDQQYAGLDTHILRYMRDQGYDVPKATPSGKKYRDVEKQFLELARKSGKTVADFDLAIWREYSGR